jgi:ribosomal protein S18 acetylase RimI-like enzyme
MKHEGELVGTVIVGHDGHRGWVYYLAIEPSLRHGSIASKLMTAAEEWLRNLGVVKVQLMVRIENEQAFGFFDKIGYEVNEVRVLSRWLTEVDSGPI